MNLIKNVKVLQNGYDAHFIYRRKTICLENFYSYNGDHSWGTNPSWMLLLCLEKMLHEKNYPVVKAL